MKRLPAVVLTLLIVAAGWVRFEQARQRLGASRLVAVAEASAVQAASTRVAPTVLRRNLELLRRAGDMDPAEVAVPMAEGGHYFLLQRYDAAVRAYRRAAALEMRSEAYANLARVYLQRGERRAALAAIDRAIALDHTQRRVFRDVLRQERQRRAPAATETPNE